jgi:hypothetical protein
MSTLRNTLESLATQFATDVLGALREASIVELSAVTAGGVGRRGRARVTNGAAAAAAPGRVRRGKGGRLARRTQAEIGKMVDAIAGLLGKHPEGMRAEQIRSALGCDPKELPRPLADGLKEGRLTKSGQKRATTYFSSAGGGGGARRAARGGKRPNKK